MDKQDIHDLIQELEKMRTAMREAEESATSFLETLHANYQESGRNLVHYLTLRRFELRPIQESLSALGISSIGHSERYTLYQCDQYPGSAAPPVGS